MMTAPNNANTYLPGVITTPSALVITNITRAINGVVTVIVNPAKEAMTYIPGQLLYFIVPQPYKMIQINGLTGMIVSVNGLDLTVDINTSLFDSFVIPSGYVGTPASIAPAGSRNLQFSNDTTNIPFKSLNNVGN